MRFETFIELVSQIQEAPLPGTAAHVKMAPPERAALLEKWKTSEEKPKKAAVLVLFYPDVTYRTRFLLTLRKTYQGVHSNQVGFPGGKVEPDDANFQTAALRETWEEVGIGPGTVAIVKPLSEIYIPPSNFIVHPFMGLTRVLPRWKLQDSEVETLIEVALSDFLNAPIMLREGIVTSYRQDAAVPAFQLNGYTVWGATAMILSEVQELLRNAQNSKDSAIFPDWPPLV